METLLAIGAVQSLFLAFVIFAKKNKNASERMLIFMLIIWSLRFLSYWMITMGYHYHFPRIIGMEQSLFLLDGPILLVYVKSLIDAEKFKLKYYLGHFLPFLTVLLYSVFMFYDYSNEEILQRFGEKLQSLRTRHPSSLAYDEKFFILAVSLSLFYYGLISLLLVRKYHQKITDSFSFTEKITLDWLRIIIISWLVFFALPLGLFLINFYTSWLPLHLTDLPLVFAFLIMIFIPTFYAFRQINNRAIQLEIYNQQMLQEEEEQKSQSKDNNAYKKSGLKEEQAVLYQNRLEKYIQEDQPYLNPDLTLSVLAEALRISPNHLSQVLNERLNRNFF